MRSPTGSSGVVSGAGLDWETGGGGVEGFCSGTFSCFGSACFDACSAKAAAPEKLSPSSPTTAMTEPTWTPLEPSGTWDKLRQ